MADDVMLKMGVELLQNNIETIIKSFINFSKDRFHTSSVEFGNAFEKYLTNALDKYGNIKNILYKDEAVPLRRIYVNQDLEFHNKRINTDSIVDLLELGTNLIINGTGGIGKSTLMKHFFINVIESTLCIPIFIELKDVNHSELNLIDCIYKSMHNLGFSLEKEYFIKALEMGKCIVLLDGFDEVKNNKREKIRTEIIELSDRYGDNSYIISSRVNQEFVSWTRFKHLEVCPLSKKQAIKLIDKIIYDNDKKRLFSNMLDTQLYEANISFASNPLLLTIMFLTFDKYAEVPEKKHEFFDIAYDVLYAQHDATKGLKRHRHVSLSSTEFKRILNFISIISYLDDCFTFSNTKLLEYISIAKKIEGYEFIEEDFRDDLIESVCLLIEDGLEYKFSHRAFQENFAAKYIESTNDEDKKNILKTIYEEKPGSISTDFVFSTLFDINRSILEKGLFIDVLKELKDATFTNTSEKHFNYLKLYYESIELDLSLIGWVEDIKDEKDAICFTLSGNANYALIRFLKEKYSAIYPIIYSEPIREDVSILKEYGEYNGHGTYIVKLDDVYLGTELYDFVLRHSDFMTVEYEYLISLLDKIVDSNTKTASLKERLFNKAKK